MNSPALKVVEPPQASTTPKTDALSAQRRICSTLEQQVAPLDAAMNRAIRKRKDIEAQHAHLDSLRGQLRAANAAQITGEASGADLSTLRKDVAELQRTLEAGADNELALDDGISALQIRLTPLVAQLTAARARIPPLAYEAAKEQALRVANLKMERVRMVAAEVLGEIFGILREGQAQGYMAGTFKQTTDTLPSRIDGEPNATSFAPLCMGAPIVSFPQPINFPELVALLKPLNVSAEASDWHQKLRTDQRTA